MPESDAQQTTGVETVSVTPETAREKFEREQQARRQGLKKFGIRPGFLSFAAKPKPQPTPAEPPVPETVPGADWQNFERGQVSRRAALRKMGVTTGMAVFALFSVDDLARMVGTAMERRAKDSQIAEVVARELKDAGVVAADPYPRRSVCYGCTPPEQCNPGPYQACQQCCDGCSCEKPVNLPCGPGGDNPITPGSLYYNDCQACCRSRNPVSGSDPADANFSSCKTASGCV